MFGFEQAFILIVGAMEKVQHTHVFDSNNLAYAHHLDADREGT